MGYRIPNDSMSNLVTESGVATSDANGEGSIIFTTSHNPNVYIVLSSEDDSTNCYIINKTTVGFSFGTSSPFKKISYKVISVSP